MITPPRLLLQLLCCFACCCLAKASHQHSHGTGVHSQDPSSASQAALSLTSVGKFCFPSAECSVKLPGLNVSALVHALLLLILVSLDFIPFCRQPKGFEVEQVAAAISSAVRAALDDEVR